MFTKKELAFFLELPFQEFNEMINDDGSEEQKAFITGRMKQEADIRKSIFDLAANGSSPAQTEAMKLIREAKMDDI